MKTQNNLFYLSGPMGSGKSTLAEELPRLNPKIIVPELFSRNIKFYTEPEHRRMLKIAGRAIENFEYLKIAAEKPDNIIVGNRCIYDCLAYNQIYYERGWISKSRYESAQQLCRDIFAEENMEPYAIILNPGFEIVMNHLSERQKTGIKKWREEDTEFVRLTCRIFEGFKGKENVLYIGHEIARGKSTDLSDINKWIIEMYCQSYVTTEKH